MGTGYHFLPNYSIRPEKINAFINLLDSQFLCKFGFGRSDPGCNLVRINHAQFIAIKIPLSS
jgi:hypothetical protein